MMISPRNCFFVLLISSPFLLTGCLGANVSSAAECPQLRDTEFAPAHIAARRNPLPATDENIRAGEKLYQKSVAPVACAECHGKRGDSTGPMAKMFNPAPRNFSCTASMSAIPDGQLHWIIKTGSPGTSMPGHDQLSDNQIWQLVVYIRGFSQSAQK